MVASLAATATGVHAVPCQTMATYLACAYAVKRDSIRAASGHVHHFLFYIIEFKNLITTLL
jgi:hypothetical protein